MGKSSGEQGKLPGFSRTAGHDIVNAADRFYNTAVPGYYPNQTYAGFDPYQQMGFNQQANFAQNTLPGLTSNTFGSYNQALNATDLLNNPGTQAGLQTIQNRANQNFMENILPGIRTNATGTGNQYSSKADQAEQIAGRNLQQVISDAQANLLSSTLGDQARLQGAALSIAPQTLGLGTLGGNIYGNIGAQQQAMTQQGINEAMARYNYPYQSQLEQAKNYAGLLSPVLGVPNTNQPQQGSMLGNVIGGGLVGGGLANSLLGAGVAGSFGAPFMLPAIAGGAILGGLLG